MSDGNYEDTCLDISIQWGGSQSVPEFDLVKTVTFNANRDVTEARIQETVMDELTHAVAVERARASKEKAEMDQLRELSTATGLNLPQMMVDNDVDSLPELIKLLAARG